MEIFKYLEEEEYDETQSNWKYGPHSVDENDFDDEDSDDSDN